MFKWIKSYMPKRLYYRAALILVFPVVFLQLIVSIVFIQRHFEGVTVQMTRTVAAELDLITEVINPGLPVPTDIFVIGYLAALGIYSGRTRGQDRSGRIPVLSLRLNRFDRPCLQRCSQLVFYWNRPHSGRHVR